ncbi:MAG: hypothetical protein WBG50_12340 [Desulfomonilaceae bacterium]
MKQFEGKTMECDQRLCDGCATGCTERHTDEKIAEEASAGPYLLFCAVLIIALCALIRWLF